MKDNVRMLTSMPPSGRTFDEIYHQNFDRLFLFALKITKSRELARDVVSDVFAELLSNKIQLEKIRQIESYLFISVKNRAIGVVSKRFDYDIDSAEAALKDIDNVSPEEILLEKELFELIENAVKALPAQCQLVFRLAKENKMKQKDIAEQLGISITTVKSQLLKATSRIKETILDHYGNSLPLIGYRQLGIILLA